MTSQSEEMLQWAGDNWLRRNRPDMGIIDLVSDLIEKSGGIPANDRALEIGCANGWLLKKLKDRYHCEVYGVEPSEAAVAEADIKNNLIIQRGVASNLPRLWTDYFDVVILGFCLWLIEPSEWFKVVAETDRVLKDGGRLIIHDYASPRPMWKAATYDEELVQHGNIKNFFYDWPQLWTIHPAYKKVVEGMVPRNGYETVCILKKNMDCLAEYHD